MPGTSWKPPAVVPRWHPLLRTNALLRLGPEEAEDLICLAEVLLRPEPEICIDRTMNLVARDLDQCGEVLAIFHEPGAPSGEFFDYLRVTRHALRRAARELATSGTDNDHEAHNPVRAVVRPRLQQIAGPALGRLGSQITKMAAEEDADYPRLVQDPARAAYLGVLCDLHFLTEVLRQTARKSDGAAVTLWTQVFEGQIETLLDTLPADEDDTQELPIPGG